MKAWHHPECVNLLESLQPEQELAEILTAWMDANPTPIVTLPVTKLYKELSISSDGIFHQVSKNTKHLGCQIGRLMQKAPWKDVISKEKHRMGETRCEVVHYRFDSQVLAKPEEELLIDDLPENSGGMVGTNFRF